MDFFLKHIGTTCPEAIGIGHIELYKVLIIKGYI
jgi:hypothetical protein